MADMHFTLKEFPKASVSLRSDYSRAVEYTDGEVKIKSITLNGEALTPDDKKNVDIEVLESDKRILGTVEGGLYLNGDGSKANGAFSKAMGENAVTLTRNSIAANQRAIAGTKVFEVLDSDIAGDLGNTIYYIKGDVVEAGLNVGDVITLQFDKLYPEVGKIDDIMTHNSEKSSILMNAATPGYNSSMARNYLKVLTKPNAGTTTDDSNQAICFAADGIASGAASFAANYKTIAYNHYAAAFGLNTKSGYAAFSAGNGTWSKGAMSFTSGQGSQATDNCAVGMGAYANALGYAAIALGMSVTSSGKGSAGIGDHVQATGDGSAAFCCWSKATALGAFAANYAQSLSPYATAFGYATIANKENQFVVGKYNYTRSNALFVVGNGISSGSRRNAFEVFENGSIQAGSSQSWAAFNGGRCFEEYSFAANLGTASHRGSAAFGMNTYTSRIDQFVVGRGNIGNSNAVFIVGNGNDSGRGNAFEVLDDGGIVANSVILKSSTEGSSKKFKITVDDSGTLSVKQV